MEEETNESRLAAVGERASVCTDCDLSSTRNKVVFGEGNPDAPLVFVGYGLRIPEQRIDDLGSVDLTGAIAVYLNAVPPSLPGVLQAHFGSAAERWNAYLALYGVPTGVLV